MLVTIRNCYTGSQWISCSVIFRRGVSATSERQRENCACNNQP
jgi:hypothetical protein